MCLAWSAGITESPGGLCMISIVSCAFSNVDSALDTILGGYAHIPGLRLTCEQASRMWALGDARCQGMFDALVDAGFLTRSSDGAYVRAR
jgi:hypothetical protein